jgi:hypothetical protein
MWKERNVVVLLLLTLEPESKSESMIGGSEVYSYRKSRKMKKIRGDALRASIYTPTG